MPYSPGLFVTPVGSDAGSDAEMLDHDGRSDADPSIPDTAVAQGHQPISHFGIQVTATEGGRKKYSFKVWDPENDSQSLIRSIDSIEHTAAYLESKARTTRRARLRLLEFLKHSIDGTGEAIFSNNSWSILTKGRSPEGTEILISIDKNYPRGRTITAASGLESKSFPLTHRFLFHQPPNTNNALVPTHTPDNTNPESPGPEKKSQRVPWTPSLNQPLTDGFYGVTATELRKGATTRWSFDIVNGESLPICNNGINSMAKLQTALTGTDKTPSPARSMIRTFVSRSTSRSGVFHKKNREWTIYCLGPNNEGVDNSIISIGPNHTNGKVIDGNDVPEHVATALRSSPPAPQSNILCSWDIATTQENTGNQHETWVYTLAGMEGAGEVRFRGAEQLRSGLAEQAKMLGIDSRTINDGPTLAQCHAFGAKGKAGWGQAILAPAGWRLESRRTVDGQEGIWLAGPGCVRGEFFPSWDGTEGGPSH